MPIKFHVLSATKEIKPYVAQLKSIAKSSTVSVKKLLPIKNVDIVFYNNPGATIDEIGGIGGFTPNANTMFIALNSHHPNFRKALEDQLPFTLAHEFNHTIRWQKEVEGDTLLEAMIFEGLADHFAMEVTGRQKPPPWSCALTSEQKKVFLKKASEEWGLPTHNNALWFFGSMLNTVPRWTGYTLGYDLVANYLESHPGILPSELVSVDASLFVN